MAKSTDFEHANDRLLPAPGDEATVGVLPIYRDAQQVVSCWELSDEEVLEVIQTKRVYLFVLAKTHPPVCIIATNPFPSAPPGEFTLADAEAAVELARTVSQP